MSLDYDVFLIEGVTTVCFQLLGTKPSAKEHFTNFVMEGSKISENSLTKWVGQESGEMFGEKG